MTMIKLPNHHRVFLAATCNRNLQYLRSRKKLRHLHHIGIDWPRYDLERSCVYLIWHTKRKIQFSWLTIRNATLILWTICVLSNVFPLQKKKQKKRQLFLQLAVFSVVFLKIRCFDSCRSSKYYLNAEISQERMRFSTSGHSETNNRTLWIQLVYNRCRSVVLVLFEVLWFYARNDRII